MKRFVLPLLLIALAIAGTWYFLFAKESPVHILGFANDDAAIAVLTSEASKQQIWSAIAHFEAKLDETETNPRVYSYYAAALSMKALYQSSPLDKQASSVHASSVFTDISETYPEQALSVLFEAITLVRSPEFLQLDDKSYQRLINAWSKIKNDAAADDELTKLNLEALTLMIQFLPIFEKTYDQRNRPDLEIFEIKQSAVALSVTIAAGDT